MAYEEEIKELLEDPENSHEDISEFFHEIAHEEGSELGEYWQALGDFLTYYWMQDKPLQKAVMAEAIAQLENLRDEWIIKEEEIEVPAHTKKCKRLEYVG